MKKVFSIITLLIFLISVEVSAIIERNTIALDIGGGFGPKFCFLGMVFSIKYFVVDNFAIELCGGGLPADPHPLLFWGAEVNYYPSFFKDYSYVNIGVTKFGFSEHIEIPEYEIRNKSSFWLLNAGIGVNTTKFTDSLTISEETGKYDIPTDFYFELGLSRFLDVDLKKTINGEEFPVDTTGMYRSGDWFFPNIEAGVRK